MSVGGWQISGDYFETCSCDFLCPCIPSNLAAPPTRGWCVFAFGFHIDSGRHGAVALDDLNFVVIGRTPGVMAEGNWEVGLIVDRRASHDQQTAIARIATGQDGGPMAAVGPLVGKILGSEVRTIAYRKTGPMSRELSVEDAVQQSVAGVAGANASEPLYVDNTLHPANTRLALGRASNCRVHAFGIDWEDATGRNNGHFAPFSWRA